MARITQQSSIGTTGTSYENEPIVKSDGASSDVMEWAASTGSSAIKVTEGADNTLDLTVDGKPVVAGVQSDGAGLHFDGAAGLGFINLASAQDLGTKFSFEFVLKADSTDASAKVFDFGNGGRFSIDHTSSGLKVKSAGSGWDIIQSTSMLADLEIHHMVVTVDGTALKLYDNGNEVAAITITATDIDDCTKARIGGYYEGTSYPAETFDGTIYRARFWNRVVDAKALFERADVAFADQYGSQTTINSGTTTKGKRYRITARDGVDFTTVGAANNNVGTEFLATGSVTLDGNDTVAQLGCVSDYDLAFANPTQSLTVQDRAGAADGTTHTSNVSQVQPVVQLNSTSARIGTSAATPADGEVIAAKIVVQTADAGIGPSADADELLLENTGNAGMTILSGNTSDAAIYFGDGDAAGRGRVNYDNNDDSLKLYTAAATRLTISSTGQVGIGKTPGHTLDIDGDVNIDANHKLRWGGGNAEIIGDGSYNLDFKTYDGSATTTKLTINSAGVATFGAKDSSEMGVTINGSNQKVSQIETVNSYTLTNGSTMEFEAPSAVFAIYVGDGQGALFFSEYQSATVTKLAGSTTFVAGDAGTAIRVYTAGSDATVTVKNSKTSGSAVLKILSLGA